MAKYLVTGGAGFIGSTLVARLLREGHEVRIVDNLSTGKRERVPSSAEFILADITNADAIRDAFHGMDGVFHTAALPRIPYSIEHPVESATNNILGTIAVLTAAKDAGVKRVVYSASSSAYGATDVLPQHTELIPQPMNPYGLQKYVGEQFCQIFNKIYGLETVCLRYFNVYGPSMADEGAYVTVISVFKQQRLAGQLLTIAGDGEQTRDFTHVYDVVDANVRAMSSPKVGKGDVLNVGTGTSHSINKIAAIFGVPTVSIAARGNEARHSMADISKTRELIGWTPQIAFEDGLSDLLREWGMK